MSCLYLQYMRLRDITLYWSNGTSALETQTSVMGFSLLVQSFDFQTGYISPHWPKWQWARTRAHPSLWAHSLPLSYFLSLVPGHYVNTLPWQSKVWRKDREMNSISTAEKIKMLETLKAKKSFWREMLHEALRLAREYTWSLHSLIWLTILFQVT